jgi:hypothetical protein
MTEGGSSDSSARLMNSNPEDQLVEESPSFFLPDPRIPRPEFRNLPSAPYRQVTRTTTTSDMHLGFDCSRTLGDKSVQEFALRLVMANSYFSRVSSTGWVVEEGYIMGWHYVLALSRLMSLAQFPFSIPRTVYIIDGRCAPHDFHSVTIHTGRGGNHQPLWDILLHLPPHGGVAVPR